MNDLSSHVTVKQNIPPVARGNGAVNGSTLDRQGWRMCAVVLTMGATDSGNVTVKLQHGSAANGSDMADFTTTSPTTAAASVANTATTITVDLAGAKRYIRAVATVASAAATANIAAVDIVLGGYIRDVRSADHDDFDGFFQAAD